MVFLSFNNQYNKCFFTAPTPFHMFQARNVPLIYRTLYGTYPYDKSRAAVYSSSIIRFYYSILNRSNGVNFPKNYNYFDASIYLLCLSIASKMMFWEGLTVISAQKHFQIKLINIAIYCNTFFDIAIYRNTFLGPQCPALLVT